MAVSHGVEYGKTPVLRYSKGLKRNKILYCLLWLKAFSKVPWHAVKNTVANLACESPNRDLCCLPSWMVGNRKTDIRHLLIPL
jgi:hypothetical protein